MICSSSVFDLFSSIKSSITSDFSCQESIWKLNFTSLTLFSWFIPRSNYLDWVTGEYVPASPINVERSIGTTSTVTLSTKMWMLYHLDLYFRVENFCKWNRDTISTQLGSFSKEFSSPSVTSLFGPTLVFMSALYQLCSSSKIDPLFFN